MLLMGKPTISMAIFNSLLYVFQRVTYIQSIFKVTIVNASRGFPLFCTTKHGISEPRLRAAERPEPWNSGRCDRRRKIRGANMVFAMGLRWFYDVPYLL